MAESTAASSFLALPEPLVEALADFRLAVENLTMASENEEDEEVISGMEEELEDAEEHLVSMIQMVVSVSQQHAIIHRSIRSMFGVPTGVPTLRYMGDIRRLLLDLSEAASRLKES